MSLEDLERKIYSRRPSPKEAASSDGIRSRHSPSIPVRESVPETWTGLEGTQGKTPPPEPGSPDEKRHFFWRPAVLISIGVFLLLVIGVGAWFVFGGSASKQSVTITAVAPSSVARGVPFDFTVNLANGSESLIQSGTLTIHLPPGLVNLGGLGTQSGSVTDDIGDVGGGLVVKRTYQFLPIGDVNSLQRVPISLSYGAGGSARFEANASQDLSITDPGIVVTITKPDQVMNGSAFTFDVQYQNTSDFDFPDVTLQAQYPDAFKFDSASLPPDSLNNYWRLGALNHGSTGTLEIKGELQGTDQSQFSIPITVSANFNGQDYPIADQVLNLTLAPSPIGLQVLLNGQSDYVARIGDTLTYTIHYQNLSGIALADTVVKATLTGELIDPTSIQTDANIDSVSDILTWNASNEPALRLLDPGASGDLTANVKLVPTFPIRQLGDKNYVVRIDVNMTSPSVPYYLKADQTSASQMLETRVAGEVGIDAKAYFRDAGSGVLNTGPFPPQVNQPTQYTVHWIIRNYATDVSDVLVHAFLASGVAWTGTVNSNTDSVPLYDDRTQEVTWTIPTIAATKGVIDDPLEATFKIQATPNATEVGQFEPLVGETALTATDDFTSSSLASQGVGLTTALPDDPTVGQNGGRVVP